jgi:hypothetical protein
MANEFDNFRTVNQVLPSRMLGHEPPISRFSSTATRCPNPANDASFDTGQTLVVDGGLSIVDYS